MKKSFKRILLEAFFRKDFLDSENKADQVADEVSHSFKWALGYGLFLGICFLLMYLSK